MEIRIDIDSAARLALEQKTAEFHKRIQRLTFDNTNAVRNAMIDTTPVVSGFNKNSHVADMVSWDTGLAYSDAPYYPYIIKGRGPVVAHGRNTYLGKDIGTRSALRFKPKGSSTYIFRKSVGPAKANDYRRKAMARAKPRIDKNVADFVKWATT